MRKNKLNNNYLRTDVIPEEAPILFSNKQLYENKKFSEKAIRKSIKEVSSVSKLKVGATCVREGAINNTVPMIMPVLVRSNKKRRIAIMHPFAQIQTFRFIVQFEKQLIIHFKKSSFSVRSPRKRNDNRIYSHEVLIKKTSHILYRYRNIDNQELSEDYIRKFRHYFSYKSVSNLNDMFKQNKFINARKKYEHLIKIDVLNFFPSIYTHTISWALYSSKRLGKLHQKDTGSFQNQADKVTQSINFNETNGIIVGPEYSRIIAEIILTTVDKNVESGMYSMGYVHGRDYQVFRYVDDTYIFYNNNDLKENIRSFYDKELEKFNLKINVNKIIGYDASLAINETSIDSIREAFNYFGNSNKFLVLQKNFDLAQGKLNIDNKKFELSDTRGTYEQWQILFSRIKDVIYNNKENATTLVNYFFSSIMHRINLSPNFTTKGGAYKYINTLNLFLDQILILLKLSPTRKTYSYYVIIQLTLLRDMKKSFSDKSLDLINDYKMNIYGSVFSSIRSVLSFDWFDPVQGYELYPLIKFFKNFDMYLTPFELITPIKQNNQYVVYTAIAYYIYDKKRVSPNFKTVEKKLYQEIKENIENFKDKGTCKNKIAKDAEFFYMVNDFSKYPGFSGQEKLFFRTKLGQASSEIPLIQEISKESYYEWDTDFNEYSRKVFMKIIIGKVNKLNNYYE